MNYFELFEIPIQLKVEKGALQGKYFELRKRYHPDYHANHTPDAQAEALERSAQLNKAFKTFQNPDETIKYVLQLKGLLEEEEKYELPADFLMQVLEINEQVMEMEDATDKSQLSSIISQLSADIYDPVKEIVEHY